MMRSFAWAVRRELWENPWLWRAPLAIGAVAALGILVAVARTGTGLVLGSYDAVAGVMMLVGVLVAMTYAVDALYGERRDRSVLFWKSLPVSDGVTVLAKLVVPVLLVPLVVWAITVGLHLLMLIAGSAALAVHGQPAALAWARLPLLYEWRQLLYHLVGAHGVFTAPVYAWMLLASAWAPRAPVAWALLPPAAIAVLERVAFGTTWFASVVESRFMGGATPGAPRRPGATLMDAMSDVPLAHFLASPGLWLGLLLAAALAAGAVALRRRAQAL